MTPDRRRELALQEELLRRRLPDHLRGFVAWAWPLVEPATPFAQAWHIDYVCDVLEAVTAGQLTRVVINLPPRHGKSLLVSVLWPVWEWLRRPGLRSVFCTYAESLALHHMQQRRVVVRHPRFRALWGERLRLARGPNTASVVHTAEGGLWQVTSIGGSVTGKGGHRLILDDPQNPAQTYSERQRDQAFVFYQHTLATRLDDPQDSATVLAMQRLHEDDLTANLLAAGYTHVCLPAWEATRRSIVFPQSGRVVIREADEPLWPARYPPPVLDQLRQDLGNHAFSAQYLQAPVPLTGGLFLPEWWRFYTPPLAPAPGDEVWVSGDLSFKDSEGSDFVVLLVAVRRGADVYLVERVKARMDFVETVRQLRVLVTRTPGVCGVLIEDAANGPAVVSALRGTITGLIAVTPEGGKLARAAACQPRLEAGQVWLPQPHLPDGRLWPGRDWVPDFVETCRAFPRGAHDDDVDALTQLLAYFTAHPPTPAPSGVWMDPPPSPLVGLFHPRPSSPSGPILRRPRRAGPGWGPTGFRGPDEE